MSAPSFHAFLLAYDRDDDIADMASSVKADANAPKLDVALRAYLSARADEDVVARAWKIYRKCAPTAKLAKKLEDPEAFFRWLVSRPEDSPHFALAVEASMPDAPRSQYHLYGHLCHQFGEEQVRKAMADFERAVRR